MNFCISCISWCQTRCFPCQMMFVSFKSNTTGVTSGARTPNISGALEFIPGFSGVRVAWSLVFCVESWIWLFVLLSFFLWPLCCLPFFDIQCIRILIDRWYLQTFLMHNIEIQITSIFRNIKLVSILFRSMILWKPHVRPSTQRWFWLIFGGYRHFLQYFSYIVEVSFIIGGNRSTCRKSLTTWSHIVVSSTPSYERSSNSQLYLIAHVVVNPITIWSRPRRPLHSKK
jgi:hypothetical protein